MTMREMGKRLGVSAVTVSKALSGKPGVSEAVRQQILRLAEEVGYVNPHQRSDAPGNGLDVGILVMEHFFSTDGFYAMLTKQLSQLLSESGHFGVLEVITQEMQRDMVLPKLLRSRRVRALILLGQPQEGYTRMLSAQPLPVVALDFHNPAIPMDAVVGDSVYGAAMMTRCLIENGHRDIGFLGNVKATSSILERYLGFVAEMRLHELPIRPECVLPDRTDDNRVTPPTLPERMPTAFVCNCDVVARAFVDQLQKSGYRVPEDVSIVSYDDFGHVPGALPLTTFRVDTAAMCRIAVQLVESRCRGDMQPFTRIVVPGECIYRNSVYPLYPQSTNQ
ncbi:MAG: LacI family DNA-binding transcriptional regulator [Clostridiales bacterium]|nr:LacI family DNA-binding transcriptional regulator [Clostridiales bacterium]